MSKTRTYEVAKGKHSPFRLPRIFLGHREGMIVEVTFPKEAFEIGYNQQYSKAFGYATFSLRDIGSWLWQNIVRAWKGHKRLPLHRFSSSRVGFCKLRVDDKFLTVCHYTYKNQVNKRQVIGWVDAPKKETYFIKAPRSAFFGMILYPYIGGDLPTDRNIVFRIKFRLV